MLKFKDMIKRCVLLTTYFFFMSTLILGPLSGGAVTENLETKDCEVKLEGEVEEMIATKHLVEVKHGQFLYSLTSFPEHVLIDYEVFLSKELRPPRLSPQIHS